MAGAPVANQNAAKGKTWRDALHKALTRYASADGLIQAGQALEKIAEKVVLGALAGDKDCIAEIGNRLDGKPAQTIEGTLDAGSALLAILTGLSQGRDNALEARGSGAVREGSAGSDSNGSARGGIPSSGRA